jgi:uncharacterized protein (TIGR00269 family)
MKNFESKIKQTIKKYKLLNKKEKTIVAISGGKDSTTILWLLKKWKYNVEALHLNLGLGKYSEKCLEKIKQVCKELEVKLHIVNIKKIFGMRMCNIRVGVQQKSNVSNCMVCGIVKKWLLNKEARRLKADKLVTGHNLDDEAQTVIMNFLQGNLMLGANSGPITGSIADRKFIPRVKPLFFSAEEKIRKYSKTNKLPVIYEQCPCAISSLRIRTRTFLNTVDEKVKLKIVGNFLKMIPRLREKLKKEKIVHCSMCGEPSRNKICKKCSLLNLKKK